MRENTSDLAENARWRNGSFTFVLMECFEVKFCFDKKKNKGVITVHYQNCAEVGFAIDITAKIFVCHTFFYTSIILHK